MFIRLNRKGQSTLEYTIIIAVVVAAILVMQAYVKRAVQGRQRDSADDIGSQFSQDTVGNNITNREAYTNESIQPGGAYGGGVLTTWTNQSQDIDKIEITPNLANEYYPDWASRR